MNACKREVILRSDFQHDAQTQNISAIKAFTTLPPTAGREEKLIVANMLSTEERTPFLNAYAKKNGFPVWEKIIASVVPKEGLEYPTTTIKTSSINNKKSSTQDTNNQRGFFIIPLIDTSTKEVTAYIACEKKNDTSYIYKTYNKNDILSTRGLNETQKKNARPLLAMFAYMEKSINRKTDISYLGEQEYKFKNVNISQGSLTNSILTKSNTAISIKQNSLATPCSRVLLDLYIITYDDGSYDIVLIFSDCLTLPGVTVVSSPRPPSSGGGQANFFGQTNLFSSSPGVTLGDPTVGNMGGGYSGSSSGWVDNPWNVYWTSLLNNVPNNPGVNQELPNEYFVQLTTITAILGLSTDQVNWLNQVENYEKAADILNFLEENEYDEEAIFSAQTAIEAGRRGFFQSWQDDIMDALLEQFLPIYLKPYKGIIKNYVKLQIAIERENDPNANSFKLFYRAFGEIIQLGLDIAGFTPVIGPVFDIASGTMYAFNGNWSNAAISATAAFPIAGEIPAVARVIKNGRRIVAKILETGVYYFPRNNKALRKALNLVVGDSRIAHHIIPLGKQDHELLQRAAKAGFDMNTATNGIPLTALQHSGSHQIYSDRVAARMTQKLQELGSNHSPAAAKTALESVITEIRNWISNHSHTDINNIQF